MTFELFFTMDKTFRNSSQDTAYQNDEFVMTHHSISRYFRLLLIFIAAFLSLKILRNSSLLHNVCFILLCTILYVVYELVYKRKHLPPGPTPWLIVGNIPDIVLGKSFDEVFQSWRKRYGPVFTVWIGPIPLVMVSDLESIKKYFVQNSDLFSNRWRNHVTDTLMGGAHGVVQVDGPMWREQRRFSLQALRNFGVGRPLMENKIMDEVSALVNHLQQNDGVVTTIHDAIAVCVGNIINRILFGIRFPQGSIEMHHLHSLLNEQSRLVVNPIMGLYITAPWTTNIPLLNVKWRKLMQISQQLYEFLQKQIDSHRQQLATDNVLEDDFIFTYMREMEERRVNNKNMGFFK
ncbi:hypothetical protein DICVIV_12397 [Dictyocaulus viviparus]|uniref:Unspecific monooxygenase n=1 Tax=Dictyocaulus viviparus TaxID=29172 RepID=A0A0D8XGZ7_DICVI|nr:hypothetical protein DICVIV_12397 [Dictyocaulus viviparus]